jgi:hypothetical protein
MAKNGIVGRGVLLDFHSWRLAQEPPIPYNAFESGSITLKQLLAVAESQGTEIRFGDILFIRSGTLSPPVTPSFPPIIFEFQETNDKRKLGYTAALNELGDEELSKYKDVLPPRFSGVEQSEEMVEWIWNHFSAVAGDQPSFECWRMSPLHPLPLPIIHLKNILTPLTSNTKPQPPPPRSTNSRMGHADWRTLRPREAG